MHATRVYVSSACLKGQRDYRQVIADYITAGLQAIELGSSHPYVAPFDESWLLAQRCRFLIHNYFPPSPSEPVINLASKDEVILAESVSHVRRALEISARVGAPFCSVHAGFITDPDGFTGGSCSFPTAGPGEAEAAFARFVESTRLLDAVARRAGVRLLIENNVCPDALKGRLLLQRSEEFLELFSAIDPTNVGVLLDFGHLNVSARTWNFDRDACVDALAPFVGAFHVHDNDGIVDQHVAISESSWVMSHLRKPTFSATPVVIESKFDSIDALVAHVQWIDDAATAVPTAPESRQ